ncbi:MAG TPA: alpha/beta fold hydrolase [Nitrospirales bacterium]|nr:alpha/beta fold hydrolase [Nitrospirales bacterium]
MEDTLRYRDAGGHETAAVLAAPDQRTDKIVVLCHGFLSTKNSSTNKALTRLLLAQGIATFRFDFFGQGDSQGPFERLLLSTAVAQTRGALDEVAARGYRRIGLMGSSFGGLVATLVASGRPDLRAVGLKCPVPDFPEMLRMEFGEAGIEAWRKFGRIPDVTGGTKPVPLHFAFYDDLLRHDAYKAAERITAPVLIVQGDCDEHVPMSQARRLMESLRSEKRLDVIEGADHSFSKAADFQRMSAALADWFTRHLS